jgi:ribosomal-protein-alanine N-acetyltransferase
MVAEISAFRIDSIQIEPADWRDFKAVRDIEKLCFKNDAWPFFDVIGILTLPSVVRFKAMLNHQIVGFIAGDIRSRQEQAWIATISVHPEYQHRGIGSLLLKECEAHIEMPCIRLSVRASNQNAIQLYRKFGYHQVGIWKNYYRGGENAVVMEKRPASG